MIENVAKAKRPSAFISYSRDSDEHRQWVADLVARLDAEGVDLAFDDRNLHPGDQLPHFMESAVRESDFALIVCTPRFKAKSDARQGGAGYEANIMTAELCTGASERKFIAILREGAASEALPSWLLGKKYVDLRDDPYSEECYGELIAAIRGLLPNAPSLRDFATSSSQHLAPEAVTRQRVYRDFVSEADHIFRMTNGRFAFWRSANRAAALMLPEFESELKAHVARFELLRTEIALHSSEAVQAAAWDISGPVIAAQIASMAIENEETWKEFHQQFLREKLPRFTVAIRAETGLR